MRVLMWLVLAVLVAAALVIAGNPPRWLGAAGIRQASLPGRSDSAPPVASSGELVSLIGQPQPPSPRESPAGEQLDVNALESAARYAQQHDSRALIVTRHGYIVYEKYWQNSSLDTPVPSEGLGRVLAALATGVAISERKIGWPDEQLSYLIPEWAHDPRGDITVRNLLQLSSGLGPDLRVRAPPGRQWRDQDVDPDLLGRVLAKATGMSYPQYLSRSIWARIGAGDATLRRPDAHGEVHVDAGFVARQGDWLRVGELLLQNGNYQGDEVIVPRWVPELLQPDPANADSASYLRLGARPAAGMSAYAAPGTYLVAGRGGTRLWLIPSLQLAILRTAGADSGSEAEPGWDDGMIPNIIVHGTRDFIPGTQAHPGQPVPADANTDVRQLVPSH